MSRDISDFNPGWFFHPGGALPREVLSYGNPGLTGDETCHWQKADNHGLCQAIFDGKSDRLAAATVTAAAPGLSAASCCLR